MKTRIGILLVRSDLVTEAQLARALEVQNFAGGRIGTLLLEREVLGEDDLGRTLALQHGCDYVPWNTLSALAPETLGVLPARFAIKHNAIPCECGESSVKVALRDPDDLRALDELVFVTGRKVLAAVAPEFRIYQALEKHYGKLRASRYAILSERLARSQKVAAPKTAGPPPPPEFFAEKGALVASSAPSPAPGSPASPAWTPFLALRAEAERPGEPEGIPWEDTTGSRSHPHPENPNPPYAPFEEPGTFEVPPFEPAREERLQESFPPPDGEGVARVLEATGRDAIADAILSALVRRFPSAAIFSSRSQGVVGWAAAGKDVDPAALRSFSMPWTEPSVFLNTRLSRNFYLGPLPSLPRHDVLAAALGGWRDEGIVQPVFIGELPVAFLYASSPSEGSFSASDLSCVQALCDAASTAFANAIRLRKRKI